MLPNFSFTTRFGTTTRSRAGGQQDPEDIGDVQSLNSWNQDKQAATGPPTLAFRRSPLRMKGNVASGMAPSGGCLQAWAVHSRADHPDMVSSLCLCHRTRFRAQQDGTRSRGRMTSWEGKSLRQVRPQEQGQALHRQRHHRIGLPRTGTETPWKGRTSQRLVTRGRSPGAPSATPQEQQRSAQQPPGRVWARRVCREPCPAPP